MRAQLIQNGLRRKRPSPPCHKAIRQCMSPSVWRPAQPACPCRRHIPPVQDISRWYRMSSESPQKNLDFAWYLNLPDGSPFVAVSLTRIWCLLFFNPALPIILGSNQHAVCGTNRKVSPRFFTPGLEVTNLSCTQGYLQYCFHIKFSKNARIKYSLQEAVVVSVRSETISGGPVTNDPIGLL